MKKKKTIITISCALALYAGQAFAQSKAPENTNLPVFTTTSTHLEYQWNDPSYDYRLGTGGGARAPIPLDLEAHDEISTNPAPSPQAAKALKPKDKGEKMIDNTLAKIPYSKQLKATWKVIDGDVDLYMKGLRVDRGNKGVEYTTDYVPFMGPVEGVMFKAEAGEDNKLKFESSHIPFVGHVEGFKFKSSVGEEASVSVRYNVSLDKLGL